MSFERRATELLEEARKTNTSRSECGVVLDDSDLIERLSRKDAGAIRYLSECLLPSLWRFVYFRVKGDRHLAEDIVSETVLALVKAAAESAPSILCPNAWMRTVATHKVQDHFRAVARVQHLIDEAASATGRSEGVQPACEIDLHERRLAIRKVMDELPDDHRLILEWKYIDQLTVHEISRRMATTEKAVESILFRARRDFRENLGSLQRDEVPFRMKSQSQQLNGRRKQEEKGCRTSNPSPVNNLVIEVEAEHPAGFDNLKRHKL